MIDGRAAVGDGVGGFSIEPVVVQAPGRDEVLLEYYFFVDIEGHASDAAVAKALDELQEHCTLMTVLGSYPRAQV